MKFGFNYGTEYIEFNLTFRKRKTMQISIKPPDIVNVIAPIGTKEDRIMEVVKAKSNWIINTIRYFKEIQCDKINKEFINGELFMYLGKDYPLQIIENRSIKISEVKLYREKLYVTITEKNKDNIRSALEKWYRNKAREQIEDRVEYYKKFFNQKPLAVRVKEQKRIWGSCTYENKLLFNWRCVMAKPDAIDYIVVHEMCHMKHKNHSKNFWNEVARVMPNYKESQKWLRKYGIKMDI